MQFTRKTDDGEWAGSIIFRDLRCEFTISACYEKRELDEIALRAKTYLEATWDVIQNQMIDELLPMHNEEWSEGTQVVTRTEFLDSIGIPEINIWEEETIMIYIPDGGLFSGHFIQLFVESPENQREITVGIIG